MFEDSLFNNQKFRSIFSLSYFGLLLVAAVITFLMGAANQDAWNELDLISLPLSFFAMGLAGLQFVVNEYLDDTGWGKFLSFAGRAASMFMMFFLLMMLLFQNMNEGTRWILVFGVIAANTLWTGMLSYSQYYYKDQNFPYIAIYLTPVLVFIIALITKSLLPWEFFQAVGMISFFFPLLPVLFKGCSTNNSHMTSGTMMNLILSALFCIVIVLFSFFNGIFNIGTEMIKANPILVIYFTPVILAIFYIAMFVICSVKEADCEWFSTIVALVLIVLAIGIQILTYFFWWAGVLAIAAVILAMWIGFGIASEACPLPSAAKARSSSRASSSSSSSSSSSTSYSSGISDSELAGYIDSAIYSHLSGDTCSVHYDRRGWGNQILDINVTIHLSTDTDYNYIRNNISSWIGQYRNYGNKMTSPTDQININIRYES